MPSSKARKGRDKAAKELKAPGILESSWLIASAVSSQQEYSIESSVKRVQFL